MLPHLAQNVSALIATAEPAGQSSQNMLAGMLIALGIALMAILLTISARSKMARRNAHQLTPRERIDQIKAAHTRAQADSAPLADHMDRMTEFATMLDNKAERLEQLLAEADERIALLRALNHPAEKGRANSPIAPAPPSPSPPPEPEPVDPLSRSVYDLADSGKDSIEIAQELDEQVGKVDLILALRGR